ncbi:MAG: hypothetical protein SH850_14055 [Planctomycetaceae bacterium]|nr:hypothetical protein [Planctomycetaceae bacterium]
MTYEDFLNTDQWQLFRRAIWDHYDGRCHICGGPGCDIHHLTYRFGLFNPRTVILVCRPCHLIWRGQDPHHISEAHPSRAGLFEIARLSRCLGLDKPITPDTPHNERRPKHPEKCRKSAAEIQQPHSPNSPLM